MDEFALKYGYLIGDLILGLIWLTFYLIRKDLRKELFWLSGLILALGVTERFFVPIYWHPGSLFNLIDKFGFGIESFLFAFFMGGIGGVTYEIFANKHIRKGNFKHSPYRFAPLIVFVILSAVMYFGGYNANLYSLIIPALLTSLLIALFRKDLFKEVILGGLSVTLLYFLFFIFFVSLFPNYIQGTYNINSLWGIYIFEVPLEEIIFAFAAGAMLSPMYEFIKGYRVYSYRRQKC